ncbi:MAG: sulfotransferase [Acidimicrobiia bacterium]
MRPGLALKRLSPATWERIQPVEARVRAVLEPVQLFRESLSSLALGALHAPSFRTVEGFVMFVGYPRSGHTLIGSLLNAHPNALVGQRIRVLRYLQAGFGRTRICGLVLLADRRFARRGRVGNSRYSYRVPDQWQGRFTELKLVGDSNVANNSLRGRPGLVAQLAGVMGVPVRLVHVIRNPYDNIATMSIENRTSLSQAVDRYFDLCQGASEVRAATSAGDWLDVRHEDLVDEPAATLRRLCEFLLLPADDSYVQTCASVVFRRPHYSRHKVAWTDELIGDVATRALAYPFLEGYEFEVSSARASTNT